MTLAVFLMLHFRLKGHLFNVCMLVFTLPTDVNVTTQNQQIVC